MRKSIFVIAFMAVLATTAFAAQESVELNVCNLGCCEFTCIIIDVECCGWCNDSNPLTVEFLGFDGEVLGSATIDAQWCNGCYNGHFATLDTPVATQDICKIRVTKTADDCCAITWMSIKGLCELPCCKSKWTMLWKGDSFWWN